MNTNLLSYFCVQEKEKKEKRGEVHLGKNTNDLLLSLLFLNGHSEWATPHRWLVRQMYNF